MGTRPDLHDKPDVKAFRSYYYLKEELAAFCRETICPLPGQRQTLRKESPGFWIRGRRRKPLRPQRRRSARSRSPKRRS